MPPRGLPGNANLEQLKNGAKSFQRAVRAGDPGAAEVVNEFHPRLAAAHPGCPELDGFTRADALLVVARRFDFSSWARLKAHLELAERYSRSPRAQPIGQPIDGESALADEFLRLGCLNYGEDDPARWERARELLDADPWLAGASVYTRGPLHEAAMRGNLAVIRLLLEHGADPKLRDPGYHATPRGWAEHHGMTEAEAYLAPLTEER